jgi:hypothetical protein
VIFLPFMHAHSFTSSTTVRRSYFTALTLKASLTYVPNKPRAACIIRTGHGASANQNQPQQTTLSRFALLRISSPNFRGYHNGGCNPAKPIHASYAARQSLHSKGLFITHLKCCRCSILQKGRAILSFDASNHTRLDNRIIPLTQGFQGCS